MKGYEMAIAHGGNVARAFEDYAAERIAALSEVCLSTEATEPEIRLAQAGIRELRMMAGLRDRLMQQMETQG